jgi:choline dehydrogenase-like flavoprotein
MDTFDVAVVGAGSAGAGGSSSVNALMGIRGIPDDYDHWAAELGCTG